LHIFPKVEELIHKEKEKQDKLIQKHVIVVDSYDKKIPSKEIDSHIASHEHKLIYYVIFTYHYIGNARLHLVDVSQFVLFIIIC